MTSILDYLIVFAIGGAVCAIAQLLINLTKFTAAKILVTFLLLGILLEAIGVFDYIKDIAKAGIIYECMAEGSITRLMAIFNNYADIPQIG
ncbi:MAG: SpoVA/SpoVAEb family sporulation membrane protein, partial [Clostridia bacterium]|nr:SpoVA/SpoVAEb family sporulation membrane protein [Clostridia bacterium]